MHGYDTYDYGFRGYYPAVGRFTTVDPLAEKYYGISPYVYCAGNPIMFIDPDGRQLTTGIPSKQKKDGVWTTAQSTTYRPIPEKKGPIKMTESKKEQIRRDEQAKRQGTIESLDQINYRRTQNEAMNNPVTKQCLTDPVLQTASLGVAGTAVVSTVSAAEATIVTMLETNTAASAIMGFATGVAQNELPTDAPPILELNPIFNLFKIAGEFVTKIKNIYDEPKEQEESAEQE